MRIIAKTFALASMTVLAACVGTNFDAKRTETVLPLNHAWVDGQHVEYVTTDISDLSMAQAAGVNYVPRLADAVGHGGSKSLVERVYKFPNGEQISIFQSAPKPAGGANTDASYSPLWRLALVQWRQQDRVHELKSEAELLSAEDAGDLSIQVTDIVVNCPITRGADSQALKGVR